MVEINIKIMVGKCHIKTINRLFKMIKLNSEIMKKMALNLDLKVGDIVLGGRFKNKRMVVKKLETDDIGQPTVNGRKLLAVRLEKKLPEDMKSAKTREGGKDG